MSSAKTYGRLSGKVCIVTGGGSADGIGWATVLRFAEEGAGHIYVTDVNTSNFESLSNSFREAYLDTKITLVKADASDEPSVVSLCAQVLEENGRLDVFYANAAINPYIETPTDYQSVEFDTFMRCMKVNIGSSFLAVKHATSAMVKVDAQSGKTSGAGSIILTGSIAGLRAGAGPTDYSASKAAVQSLARSAAYVNNLNGVPVRVNAVCPGIIETGMTAGILSPFRGRADLPVKFGSARDVANAVVFLASDESGFMNGQEMVVDNVISSSIPTGRLLSV